MLHLTKTVRRTFRTNLTGGTNVRTTFYLEKYVSKKIDRSAMIKVAKKDWVRL
jgi:hypothetical protein